MQAAILQLRSQIETRFDLPLAIRPRPDLPRLITGIPAIDRLMEGGIPRGTLSEICGAESTGRTALLLSLLREATRRGEYCAWIDAEGAFDPASAAAAGVLLDRILWVNCGGNPQHALKATDLLIQAGGFGLVVFDLAGIPTAVTRRIPLASWFRLRHAAERMGAALVALEREINARSCSALQLEIRRARPVWKGRLLHGLKAQPESRKHYRSQTAEFLAVF
jgi:RecA/RadA recombinase